MTPNTPPETTAAELLELLRVQKVTLLNSAQYERVWAAVAELAALKAQQPADLKTPGEIDAWFNGRFHTSEQAQQPAECTCPQFGCRVHTYQPAQQPSGAQAGLVRQKVYAAIDSEREHQDRKWGTIAQHPHEVGAWLTVLRNLLAQADAAWSGSNADHLALEEIRKIAATAVACGEQHGLRNRHHSELKEYKRHE